MPIVYEVSALYRRTVQPKEYESATAEIGMKAQLEDGDNIEAVTSQLLTQCRDLTVRAVTGKRIDGKSLKDIVGKTEAEVEVKKVEAKAGRGVSDTPEDRGEQEDALPGDDGEADAAAEKKRLAAEKRKATAAKKKADAAEAEAAATEEGEDDGAYDASAFEDEGDAACAQISTTDLQHFITGSVSDKKITVLVAKEIMSQHGDGAGRVKDIPEGSRNKVHEEIKAAIAE